MGEPSERPSSPALADHISPPRDEATFVSHPSQPDDDVSLVARAPTATAVPFWQSFTVEVSVPSLPPVGTIVTRPVDFLKSRYRLDYDFTIQHVNPGFFELRRFNKGIVAYIRSAKPTLETSFHRWVLARDATNQHSVFANSSDLRLEYVRWVCRRPHDVQHTDPWRLAFVPEDWDWDWRGVTRKRLLSDQLGMVAPPPSKRIRDRSPSTDPVVPSTENTDLLPLPPTQSNEHTDAIAADGDENDRSSVQPLEDVLTIEQGDQSDGNGVLDDEDDAALYDDYENKTAFVAERQAARVIEQLTGENLDHTRKLFGLLPRSYAATEIIRIPGTVTGWGISFAQAFAVSFLLRKMGDLCGAYLANQVGTGKTRVVLALLFVQARINRRWESWYDELDALEGGEELGQRRHLGPYEDQNPGDKCPSKWAFPGCVCERDGHLRSYPYQPGPTAIFAHARAVSSFVDEFNKAFGVTQAAGGRMQFRLILAHDATLKAQSSGEQYTVTQEDRDLLEPEYVQLAAGLDGCRPKRRSDRLIVLTTYQSWRSEPSRYTRTLGEYKLVPGSGGTWCVPNIRYGKVFVDEAHEYRSIATAAPSVIVKHILGENVDVPIDPSEFATAYGDADGGATRVVYTNAKVVFMSGTPVVENVYEDLAVCLDVIQRCYENQRDPRSFRGRKRWVEIEELAPLAQEELLQKIKDTKKITDVKTVASDEEIAQYAREAAAFMGETVLRHNELTRIDGQAIVTLPPTTTKELRCKVTAEELELINEPAAKASQKALARYKSRLKEWQDKGGKGKKPDMKTILNDSLSSAPLARVASTFPNIGLVISKFNAKHRVHIRLLASDLTENQWDGVNRENSPCFPSLDELVDHSPKLKVLWELLKRIIQEKSEFYFEDRAVGSLDNPENLARAYVKILLFTSAPWTAHIIDLWITYRVNNLKSRWYIKGGRTLRNVLFTQGHNNGKKRLQRTNDFNEKSETDQPVPDSDKIDIIVTTNKCGGTGINMQRAKYLFMMEPAQHPSLSVQVPARARRAGDKEKKEVYILMVEGCRLEQMNHDANNGSSKLRELTEEQKAAYIAGQGPLNAGDNAKGQPSGS